MVMSGNSGMGSFSILRITLQQLRMVEMREDFFAEQTSLLEAVVAPEFQHHLGAARGAIFLEFFDALFWRTRDGTNLLERRIGEGARSGFAAAFFHSVGDGLDFFAR